jgi:signal transduction histidine kinase
LKKYELESLIKSFLLFFISLGIFLSIIIYLDYKKQKRDFEQSVLTKMRICSFDLECPEYKINFVVQGDKKPFTLYHIDGGLGAYFPLPSSKEYFLSILYPAVKYESKLNSIRRDSIIYFFILLLIIAILSILFTFYALHPMKKAFVTIEEFIKDILHDFNTPLSSIILNSSLLEEDGKNREKIQRIKQSSHTILSLQENLREYLKEMKSQKEEFALKDIVSEKKKSLQKIYPDIDWSVKDIESFRLYTNKDAFSRIIANLLSNAAKYNKKNGVISVEGDLKRKTVTIKDSGIGIENPNRIFDRFYTENDRGLGIGLHIVKKLCDELKIGITVTSRIGVGSSFVLDLKRVTKS